MYNAHLSVNALEDDEESIIPASPPSVTQRGFVKYHTFNKQMHVKSRLPSSYNLFKRATVQYNQVIESINPTFKTDFIFIPRRTLTNPREPSKNSGYDNIHDDYILRVKDIIGDVERYEILDLMGQGTFGQVVICKTLRTGELVAIKLLKNQPSYRMQGEKEVAILSQLKSRPRDKDRFLQLRQSFVFRGHLCAVFELLSISLHNVLSQRPGRPNLAISDIQKISFNILETLALLKDMRIIHTDLKPDNILLKTFDDIHNVKLIDYGSALFDGELNYCIQTAFYRSPEVILQAGITCAIDMWSFGCFVAEMYTGRALFPSGNEATLLHMMAASLQCLPPDDMLRKGKKSSEFFDIKSAQNGQTRLKELVNAPHDMPISSTTLKDRITGLISNDDDDSKIDNYQEMIDKENLYDFLSKILIFDPNVRLTPEMALQHKFITSAMGNRPVRPSLNHHSTISTEPQIQRPALQQSKSTGALTLDMIHASLTKAAASSSSLNTSRTTEDSIDILTPNNSQINVPAKVPVIQDGLTSRPYTISPHVTIAHKPSKNNATSPFPKPILKKSTSPSKFGSSPVQRQQENTLDRQVTFLQQSRPSSATQSNESNLNQIVVSEDPIPNVVNVNTSTAAGGIYNQNYTTQNPYTVPYGEQMLAYIAQTAAANTTAQPIITAQPVTTSANYALSPTFNNANLPYIYQQAQQLQQQLISPHYYQYPQQFQQSQQQQQQQQQKQQLLHQQQLSPLLMYYMNENNIQSP